MERDPVKVLDPPEHCVFEDRVGIFIFTPFPFFSWLWSNVGCTHSVG